MQKSVTAKEVQLTSYDDNVVHNKSGSGNNKNKNNSKSNNDKDNSSSNNDTDNQAKIEVPVTFCSHVGWNGVLVMCFSLVMALLFFYLTYEYSVYFLRFNRDFVWVFIVMACLFLLFIIYYLVRWKKMANDFMEEERKIENKENSTTSNSCFQKAKTRYNDFQIFGKYYLFQLYTSEILESINQINNLFTVYTCSLPVAITSILCIVLSIDCFHTVSFMVRKNDPNRRDRQIIIDTLVDCLCIALPLMIMWFGYRVPISIEEMMQVSIYPAFTILMKLDTILEEIIRSRTAMATLTAQEQAATRASRRRKSLFRGLSHYEIGEQQQLFVPYYVHLGAGICKFAFGILFLIVAIVQLTLISSVNETSCNKLLWESCVVKTPFCGTIFTPTCNCAVLNVRKHNWTKFPNKIYNMNALKVMQINHGPLEVIPDGFDKRFSKVSVLDLSYNELTKIPESLGNMGVNMLQLANNNLNELPDSVWGNDYIFVLELDNNNISIIPTSIQNAKSLSHFSFSNNSVIELRNEIFTLSLVTLMADGNNINKIPENIGYLISLQYLRFNNNRNIPQIPKTIGGLVNIREFDVRNNSIESLPEEFVNLKRLQYAYFHNNPMCSNGWLEDMSQEMKKLVEVPGAGCTEQCSPYCQDAYFELGTCLRECNTIQCKYQNGVCLKTK
jgi:hypothetical protein